MLVVGGLSLVPLQHHVRHFEHFVVLFFGPMCWCFVLKVFQHCLKFFGHMVHFPGLAEGFPNEEATPGSDS